MKELRVSELAELATCERRIYLKSKYGDLTTFEQDAARSRGVRIHDQAYHEKKLGAGTDRRCFIATSVYGADAPETERLRRFRDERLLQRSFGRQAVRLYYAVSPAIASWLDGHRTGRTAAARILGLVIRIIDRW